MVASMPFRSGLIGNVFIVRWLSVPASGENRAVLQALREATRQLGAPVVFVNMIPEGVDLPSAEARADMQAITPQLLECTGAIQLVIGGEGVMRTMLRSLVRAMTVAGRRGNKVAVHSSLAEFVRANEKSLGIDRTTFMARLEREGLT
jgi:hypothetical protein